ncbi:MAG TPA: hypothetical protein PKD64_10550 [Pirellulaceae bacterium]|nr:hypothetical protein [Pirellulaceae bacterium]HMO92620.1 hypothetical protein [Pirellulaceae bacterium]HMP70688.1 hypothetical protein [Pirellulaceae bacterium]
MELHTKGLEEHEMYSEQKWMCTDSDKWKEQQKYSDRLLKLAASQEIEHDNAEPSGEPETPESSCQ